MIEEILGKKIYEKKLKEKPEEFLYPIKTYENLYKLLDEARKSKSFTYNNEKINVLPVLEYYKNEYGKEEKHVYGRALYAKHNENIYIILYKSILDLSRMEARAIIAHELGHAISYVDMKQGKRELSNKNQELIADKNIEKYLKNIKIEKEDRQAIYYILKKMRTAKDGRYDNLFKGIKYLKDHFFGFSSNQNIDLF